jgi:HSP20 family protein
MFGLVRPGQVAGTSQIQPWNPWSELAAARQEMDDFVTRAFGFTPLSRMLSAPSQAGLPPVELYETGEGYQFRVHLPGISREDINLEVAGHRLALWGERRGYTPPEGAKVLANTATCGGFRFAYELPEKILTEDVKATYRDGILEVWVPKAEPVRTSAVKVAIEE